jgi:hypothetical protein
MRVIAASFQDLHGATRTATRLAERLALPFDHVKMASLGAAGTPQDGRPLLAAYVPEPEIGLAHAIMRDGGGTVVAVSRVG